VVKPNVGKPLTIKPQMAPPPEPAKPQPKPAPAATKKPTPPAKPSAKPTAPAAKKPEGKGDRHSSELSKRKPR
jgi:protein TonB